MKFIIAFAIALLCAPAFAQQQTPIIGLPLAGPTNFSDSVPICQQSGCTMANSLASATLGQINQGTNTVGCKPNIDCAPLVNAALAPVNGVYPNVHIPAGTWYFQNPVTLAGGQQLFCDGWGNTTLTRDHTFNKTAAGWFILTQSEQNSPIIHDCNFSEDQPNTPTAQLTNATISGTSLTATIVSGTPANGNLIYDSNTPAGNAVAGGQTLSAVSIVGTSLTATVSISQSIGPESMTTGLGRSQFVALGTCDGVTTGCAYSPVIYNQSSNRAHLYNLRFNHTWDAIVSPGQMGGFFVENIQNGSLDDGISIGSSGDISHIRAFHTWNFGDSGPLFALFVDGGGYAGIFGTAGAIDGINVVDWFSYNKHTRFEGDATSSMKMVVPFFDSGASLIVDNAQHFTLVSPSFDGHPSNGLCQLNVNGGTVQVTDLVMFSTNLSAYTTQSKSICTSHVGAASHLNVTAGRIAATASNFTLVTIAGTNSSASFNGVYFRTVDSGSGAWTNPLVSVSADSGIAVQFLNNRTDAAPSGGNSGLLSIASDSSDNIVNGNNWNGWSFTQPGGNTGFYGLNSDALRLSRNTNIQWMTGLGAVGQTITGDNGGDLSIGTNGSGALSINGTPGVSSSGSPTSGFTTVKGVVTAH